MFHPRCSSMTSESMIVSRFKPDRHSTTVLHPTVRYERRSARRRQRRTRVSARLIRFAPADTTVKLKPNLVALCGNHTSPEHSDGKMLNSILGGCSPECHSSLSRRIFAGLQSVSASSKVTPDLGMSSTARSASRGNFALQNFPMPGRPGCGWFAPEGARRRAGLQLRPSNSRSSELFISGSW